MQFYIFKAQAASLPLGGQSNPFVPAEQSSTVPDVTSSLLMGVDQHADIVSRSQLSDKQQQIKTNFEEKERQELRRKVTQEKLKQKQVYVIVIGLL